MLMKKEKWMQIGSGIGIIAIDLFLFLSLLIPQEWLSEEMLEGAGVLVPILAFVGWGNVSKSIGLELEEEDLETDEPSVPSTSKKISLIVKIVVGVVGAALILLIGVPNQWVTSKEEKIVAIIMVSMIMLGLSIANMIQKNKMRSTFRHVK